MSRSTLLRLAPKVSLLAAICIVFQLVTVRAAEPILTLAMLKTDSFEHRSQSARTRFVPTAAQSAPVQISALSARASHSFMTETLSKATTLLLQKPEREPRNPLLLAWAGSRFDSRSRGWASARLHAGFGQVFQDRSASVYGHNGTGWQEPGCGYLKLHFRF